MPLISSDSLHQWMLIILIILIRFKNHFCHIPSSSRNLLYSCGSITCLVIYQIHSLGLRELHEPQMNASPFMIPQINNQQTVTQVWAKCGPLPTFINKVLLEHNHTHLTKPKIFAIWPLTENSPDPCPRHILMLKPNSAGIPTVLQWVKIWHCFCSSMGLIPSPA